MIEGWKEIQQDWTALQDVCYKKMKAFQDIHGSLETLTKSVTDHQREFIKYSEQMRIDIDIDSADKFVAEVLPVIIRGTEKYEEFCQIERSLPTMEYLQMTIQEDAVQRAAILQQCMDYRTQMESVINNAKRELEGTVQQELESNVTAITATCNVETLKCIGAIKKCESVIPEMEAAIAKLNQLEEL